MRKKIPVALRMDADLIERLDRFQASHSFPITRIALIETAIRQMLDREEQKARASSGKKERAA
jgi:predicted transcriptional regulator